MGLCSCATASDDHFYVNLYSYYVNHLLQLSEDCPLNCNCSWYSLDMVQNTNPVHSVKVDCSNRQLSSLPENLPENTVFLNVTNNNVSNIYILNMYIYRVKNCVSTPL